MEGKDSTDTGTPNAREPSEFMPPNTRPRHKFLPLEKSSQNEQRVTEDIVSSYRFQLPTVTPEEHQRLHGNFPLIEDLTPSVTAFKTPSDQGVGKDRDELVPLFTQNPYFRRGGDKPKLQMAYVSAPGKIPRKLAIERRRREYLMLDFEKLLEEKGIDSNLIMPRQPGSTEEYVTTPGNPISPYLPPEMFDNYDYDCRTPDDWLSVGNDEESPDQKPLPGKALLSTEETTASCVKYSWHPVGVLDYSKEKREYLVEKVHVNNLEPKIPGIKPLLPGTQHWVPRIRLLFFGEDPRIFVERLQFAMNSRKITEALLFNQSAVDCMPIWEGTPTLDTDSLQRIDKHARSTPTLRPKIDDKCADDLVEQVKLEHSRVMNGMIFVKVVKNNSEEFSNIILPMKEPELVPEMGCVSVPWFDYEKNKSWFIFHSLLTKAEVIHAISEIWTESNKVANMRLFNICSLKPLRLEEFEVLQSQVHTQMTLYLQESWTLSLSNSIRSNLCDIVQGAYNINESHWDMYRFSKLYRLMAVVRFKMQDSLRFLVMDSLRGLANCLLDASEAVLTCPKDLVWGSDLINSPFPPKQKPVFLVDLVLEKTNVQYSTPPESFAPSLVNLIDKGILTTYKIPQLDKFVMKRLFVGGDPMVLTVNVREPEVNDLREKIRFALTQAVIPLKAYAAEYEEHLELYNLDTESFLNAQMEAKLTAQQVRTEVELHLKEKERIERTLPCSIVIGPFMIRVEAVRQALANKRQTLADTMLNRLAASLRKRIDAACEECDNISRRLHDKPDSIEELEETREWMKNIPDELKSYRERLGKIVADYDVLEGFLYQLSNEDNEEWWVAVGWPHKIINEVEEATIQHVEDEEMFRDIHQANQISLEEQLDSLEMHVAGFGGHAEFDHVHEYANEMRRTMKQLTECQALAETYNMRENLLGLTVTNYDRLKKLIEDTQPFRFLWTTASDWLRWQESWLHDPLTSIVTEQLERCVAETHETMQRCFEHFTDIPECQGVASHIMNQIEEFRCHIPLIKGLRSFGMKRYFWEMLSELIHKSVKPKANLTLTRCLELGLQNHMEEIAHVVEEAEKDPD